MNRAEEYRSLLAELDFTPPALHGTALRAKNRLEKRRRIRRAVSLPLGSLCTVFAVFVLLVNVSLPFARACGRVPVLSELAAAVSFSPSLSAAVEHEYVQPILQKQTENGITLCVEYVIADQKQLNIFYSLDSELYEHLEAEPSVAAADGGKLEGFTLTSGYGYDNDSLRKITLDFMEGDMPDRLNLTCRVYDRGDRLSSPPVRVDGGPEREKAEAEQKDYLAVFTFPLSFDPAFTQQGRTYTLNRSFLLAGQKFTATTVEVYPTHVRLNFADDAGNTAWLTSLAFYLEDASGKRYDRIGNGITATGSSDSPAMTSHRLESAYFSGSRRFSITITGAVLLDKDKERIRVDLKHGTADFLPEGIRLEEASRENGGWQLMFSGPARKENTAYQLFNTDYYDEAGNRYEFDTWTSRYADNDSAAAAGLSERFETRLTLLDYPYDTVYLSPLFSRTVKAEVPIVLEVR